MRLLPWSYRTAEGFTLRGWHSPASGKPLLHVLHGNGFCGRVYEPMLAPLSTQFDLWLSDVQGHGESDHGGRFCGWDRSAELAAEAFSQRCETFAEVPRHALGHSFGGVLTALLLARQPGLFRRAVLLDPVLFNRVMLAQLALARAFALQRRHGLARRAAARRSQWPDRAAALAALQGRGIFKGWTAEALAAYVQHALRDDAHGVALKCAPAREADVFSSMPRGLWPALQAIRTPTLIVHGDRSYPFVAPSARRLAAHNRAVTVQQVDGGHCFMQEAPQLTASRVAQFLDSA